MIFKKQVQIFFDNDKVDVFLKRRSGQKNIRLFVQNGSVFVSAPFFSSWKSMISFAEDQKEFIVKGLCRRDTNIFNKDHYKKNKKFAEKVLLEYSEFWIKKINLCPEKIIIKNQTSRWGSCNSKKIVSLNYRLAFLPKILAEYVIVHELCHLRFMNHKKDFWSLVSCFLPDYKKHRQELKKISSDYF